MPPGAQPGLIRRALRHPRASALRGILAQRPLALSLEEARAVVSACRSAKVPLQVNQNMRYDPSVRACKRLLEGGKLGAPVLATIELRAAPRRPTWAEGGRSLSTFQTSVDHLDTFRYWLGDPLPGPGVDPAPTPGRDSSIGTGSTFTSSNMTMGLGPRAGTTSGPGPDRDRDRDREGDEAAVRWRVEGTEGLALGAIGRPIWPDRVPSTIDYRTAEDRGEWQSPRWPVGRFPDPFAAAMAGLMVAIESGDEPEVAGRDNFRTIALCEAVLRSAQEHRATVPRLGSVGERGE